MKKNPKLQIEILGQICYSPQDTDGKDMDIEIMDLPVKRTNFVEEFPVTKIIDKDRITYIGRNEIINK